MRRSPYALRLVAFVVAFLGGGLIAPASRAEVLSPQPGEVYREFHRIMSEYTTKDWRVTDPNATHPGSSPTNKPSYYLPNAKLPFTIPAGALVGATRAELVIDYWGGHVGTTGQKVRFNDNAWLTVPTLTNLASPQCYVQQWNPGLAVPLAHLREGTNTIEGLAGPQTCWSMNWGQWGWYAAILRVYYNPLTAGGPTGAVISPLPGATFGESPTISVSATPFPGTSISKVEVLARYDGADWDGDGLFLEYHQAYHKLPGAMTIATSRHVGTDASSPYGMVWDTTLVPDQSNVRLLARIQASNGLWYVTPEVTGLTLDRPSSSVAHYKPSGVPQCFWVSAGRRNLSSKVVIPAGVNLTQATSAKLLVATWNGIDGQAEPGQTHFTRFNSWTAPNYGQNHFYSMDVLDVPVSQLRNGDNIVHVDSASTHHGIEFLWPGPQLIVRFGTPSNPVCGNGVLEAGEQCDDGNTVSGDGCQSNCTLPPAAICGNGVREAGEQCDDGNTVNGDGCQSNCTLPPSATELPAMYRFEEPSGATAQDEANDNDGTLEAGATRDAAGRFGRAVRFDGLSGRVNLGGLDVGGQAATFALWLRADDFGIADARLLSKAAGTDEQAHYWMLSTVDQTGTRLRFRLKTNNTTSTVVANTTVGAGAWIHVAAVYDGAQLRLYQNGTLVGSASKSGTISGSSGVQAWIGDNPGGGRTFDGAIDEVLIDDRAWTTQEIQNLVEGPVGGGVCGDGTVGASEQCDDGNAYDGDGCQANCQFPACGDGIEDPGEACDDGNTLNGDSCQRTCDLPACGDGIVDGGEECDDAGVASGDGCESDCVNKLVLRVDKLHQGEGAPPQVTLSWIGDYPRFEIYRAIDDPTSVDDPSHRMGDTASYAWTDPGTPATNGSIAYYSVASRCGNGALEAGEACDDGNNVSGDGCRPNCAAATCGNGVIDAGEACDDGNAVEADACSNACQSQSAPGVNALRNGNFAAGTSGWYLYSNGSATLGVEGGAARVAIDVPGTNVQLLQTPLSVEGGTRYRLRFKARNTGGDDLRVQLYQHAVPNTSYGLDALIDLTTVDQQFEVFFFTPAGNKTDARFSVWLADWDQADHDYWFDDFELTRAP